VAFHSDVLVALCVTVLLTTCYPTAVFFWGDEVQRHERTLQRRKLLWGFIATVTLVGLSSRLLFEPVSSWLPR
jgi:hypothetical protein